jgi:chromosome partitioning protein
MKVIVIAQHKGGVGKTTSALGIGHSLVLLGKRVLLLDCDPQSNLSSSFADLKPANLCMVLRGEASLSDVVQPVGERLSLVAARPELSPLERMIGADATHPNLLRRQLAPLRAQFDYLLIDTPPSMGPMTVMSLTAADYVIAPMRPDPFAFAGFYKLLDMVDAVRDNFNAALELKGLFLTQYHPNYRGQVYHDFAAELARQPRVQGLLTNTSIRINAKLVEAVALKTSIHAHAPDSNSAQDYLALTRELLTRLPA